MSQAEKLLDSLAEPVTVAAPSGGEGHIVINKDRSITIPDGLKRIAVQFDHNVETVTFDCPRYWDEHDFATMRVYINYRRADGYKNQYPVKNLRVDRSNTSIIHFDWTIDADVTPIKGNISFLVCIKKVGPDGLERNHWNSLLNQELMVEEGMECEEAAIEYDPALITHLLTRMDEVEAIATPEAMQGYVNAWLDANQSTAIAELENKGDEVLASIPDDYTTAANNAETATRIKANAIASEASGDTIVISDSADAYMLGMNIYGKTEQYTTTGKQLFDANTTEKFNTNAVYTVNGDTITYDSSEVYMVLRMRIPHENLIAGKTYVMECDSITKGLICQILGNHVAAGQTLIDARLMNGNTRGEFTIPETVDMSIFDTFNEGEAYLAMSFFISETMYSQVVQEVKGLRLYAADDPMTEWEAYSGGVASPSPNYPMALRSIENPTTYIYGSNMFPIKEAIAAGLTGTPQPDGSVHYTGTATENAWHAFQQCPIYRTGTYTLTVETKNKTTKGSLIQIFEPGSMVGRTWANTLDKFDCTFEARAGGFVRVCIGVNQGDVVDLNIKIQLNPGNTVVDWTPCDPMQTFELPRTLYGIPVTSGGNHTDSEGQQWICDEIDFERGVYVQRLGHYVFDGSADENWKAIDAYNGAYSIAVLRGSSQYNAPLYCNYSRAITWGTNSQENHYCFINGYDDVMFGGAEVKAKWPSLTEWRGQLQVTPMEVIYLLASPIETPLPADELEAFKSLRTNYLGATILNDSGCHMTVKYAADTKHYIDSRGATDEQVSVSVREYMAENPPDIDMSSGFSIVDKTTAKRCSLYIDNGKLIMQDSGGGSIAVTLLTNEDEKRFVKYVNGESPNSSGNIDVPVGVVGYTPVRGIDYWTEADKADIKTYVEEAILGGVW